MVKRLGPPSGDTRHLQRPGAIQKPWNTSTRECQIQRGQMMCNRCVFDASYVIEPKGEDTRPDPVLKRDRGYCLP